MHITATGLPIDEEHFPDGAFRNIINTTTTYNPHADGYLSRYERSRVTTMKVFQKNIADMTGVNYFTNLTSLNCGGNNLSTLDVTALTKLENLECYACQLRNTIDLTHCPMLKTLDVGVNNFTTIDLSANTKLTSLNANRAYIRELDVSMCPDLETIEYVSAEYLECLESINVTGCTKLTTLNCPYNKLTSLDVSTCTALQRLNCSYGNLTSLTGVSNCTELIYLVCNNCSLTSIGDVTGCKDLALISCNNNSLTGEQDLTGLAKLGTLYCQNNRLTSLKLDGCTKLSVFFCQNNRLPSLDLSDARMTRLNCSGNPLTTLDVSGKELEVLLCQNCTSLKTLDISNNKLYDDNTYFVGGAFSIAGCTALEEIYCQQNTFSGIELDKLITDLPTVATPSPIYLISNDESEQNACTAEQALTIFGKGWLPQRKVGDEWQLIPFEGEVTVDGLLYKCIVSDDGTLHAEVAGVESQDITAVTFPEGVALAGNTTLFPVMAIATEAFKDCTALAAVTIPEHITTIGDKAFDGCTALSEVTMQSIVPPDVPDGTDPFPTKANIALNVPFGITAYAEHSYWSTFRSVASPNYTEVVDEYTLRYRCYLDASGQPDHAEVVGFDSCPKRYVYIAESVSYQAGERDLAFPVTKIVENAFYGSGGFDMSNIVIPPTIHKIENHAFFIYGSPQMFIVKSTTRPPTDYDNSTGGGWNNPFSNNALGASLIVPAGAEANYKGNYSYNPWNFFFNYSPQDGFYDAAGRIFVHIESPTSPVAYAGYIGDDPTTVTIPESATSGDNTYAVSAIWPRAFIDCPVEHLDIPTFITTIYSFTFAEMSSLKSIKVGWKDNLPTAQYANLVFNNTDLTDVVLYVPCGTKALYESTSPWNSIPTIIELGDANADGELTIADALDVVNHLLGQPTSEGFRLDLADANDDGQVTIADVTTVLNIILTSGGN